MGGGVNHKWIKINNAIQARNFQYNEKKRKNLKIKLGLEGVFVLGTVGRITHQKNSLFLADIFEEFNKINPNSVFLHIGDGDLRNALEKKITDKGLKKLYFILGEQEDTADYYQVFDAFVFPSNYEGLGIVLIEAQASGTPCIISNAVPIEADMQCGLFYPVGLHESAAVWARQIKEHCFIDKRDTYNYIKAHGYDAEENAKVMERILDRELRRKRHAKNRNSYTIS